MSRNLTLVVAVIVLLAVHTAVAQKAMSVTIVNNTPDTVTSANVMEGSLVTGIYRKTKALALPSPIGADGRSTLRFEVPIQNAVRAGGFKVYATKYAIEVIWNPGCKKLLDINYEAAIQTVKIDGKRCGLYQFEVAQVENAKREADGYYREKDYSMAEEYYSRIIDIDPHNEHALHRRGHAFLGLKNFPPAIADFTAAIQVTGDPAHLHNDRGNAYYAAKDYAKAAADYGRAYEIAPTNTTLQNRWASLCLAGMTKEADADQKKLQVLGVTMKGTCADFRQISKK